MNVVAINGSPKAEGQSLSERMIGQMEKRLGVEIKTYQAVRLVRTQTPPDIPEDLLRADVLLIVHPLYVDALPAPLIELLTRLENAAYGSAAKPQIFAIVHCGYYESEHTALALEMAEHFACRAGYPGASALASAGGRCWQALATTGKKAPHPPFITH